MRATWIAALTACLAAGCGKDPAPKTPAAAGGAPAVASHAADPAAAPADPAPKAPGDPAPKLPADGAKPSGDVHGVRIALLDPGAQPRIPFRYHPTAGAKAQYEMVTTQKNKTGNAPHLTVQTTTVSEDVEVASVDAAGNARLTMSMHDLHMDLPGQPGIEQANQMFEGFKLRFTGRMSPLGAWSETAIRVEADPSGKLGETMKPMMDSLGETMNQISVQFPSEPLGVGARWTAEGSLSVLGMTVTSTTTMTVESITGQVVVLKSAMTGGVKDQKMTMAGVESEVHEMTMSGGGTLTVDFSSAIAASMEMTVQTQAKMTVHVPGQMPQDMDIDSTMDMKLSEKK